MLIDEKQHLFESSFFIYCIFNQGLLIQMTKISKMVWADLKNRREKNKIISVIKQTSHKMSKIINRL